MTTKRTISPEAVIVTLPIIKNIRAALEFRLLEHPSLEKAEKLPFYGIWGEYEILQIIQAWQVIDGWTKEKGFRFEKGAVSYYFVKTDATANWWEANDLISKNIREHDSVGATQQKTARRKPPSEITFTAEGDISRGQRVYPLRAPLRIAIIKYLIAAGERFVETGELRQAVSSTSDAAVRNAISAINGEAKRHLKIKDNLIEGVAMRGYRINPKHKLVQKR